MFLALGAALSFGNALDPTTVHRTGLEEALGPPEPEEEEYIPPGFRGSGRSSRHVVDVYFHNRRVGEADATFTAEWLQFKDPKKLVALLPGIANPNPVTEALSAKLPTNGDKACYPVRFTGCGTLDTDTAAVIYSEGNFRTDIFVAGQFLETKTINLNNFLPPPNSGVTSLLNLNAATAGPQRTSTLASISAAIHPTTRIIFLCTSRVGEPRRAFGSSDG